MSTPRDQDDILLSEPSWGSRLAFWIPGISCGGGEQAGLCQSDESLVSPKDETKTPDEQKNNEEEIACLLQENARLAHLQQEQAKVIKTLKSKLQEKLPPYKGKPRAGALQMPALTRSVATQSSPHAPVNRACAARIFLGTFVFVPLVLAGCMPNVATRGARLAASLATAGICFPNVPDAASLSISVATLEKKNREPQSLLPPKTRALELVHAQPQPAAPDLPDTHTNALRERVASLEKELQSQLQELQEKSQMVANMTQQLASLKQRPGKRDLLHVGIQTLLICGIWMILIWKLRRYLSSWRASQPGNERKCTASASKTHEIADTKVEVSLGAGPAESAVHAPEQCKNHHYAQLDTKTRLAVGGLVLHALRPRSGVLPAKGACAIMLSDVCDAIYYHLVNPTKIARTTIPMLVAEAYSSSARGLALASKVQLLEHQTIRQDKNVSAFVHVQSVDMDNQSEADTLVRAVQSVADIGLIAVNVVAMDQSQLATHLRAMLCHLKLFTTTNMPRPFQVSAMQKELGLCGPSITRDCSDSAIRDHRKTSAEATCDPRDSIINHGEGEVAENLRGAACALCNDKDSTFFDGDVEDVRKASARPRPGGVPPIQMSKLKDYVERTMASMESKKEAVLRATTPPARAVVNP